MKNKKLLLSICVCLSLFMIACGKKENSDDLIYKSKLEKTTEYKGIEYQGENAIVSDEDVNDLVEETLEMWVHYEEINKKVVEDGDTINISYIAYVDGEETHNSNVISEDGTVDIDIGAENIFKGLDEKLIGCVVGSNNTIKLVVPSDYYDETLRNKEITFNVNINSIKQLVSPTLTDIWVQKYGFENVENFKESCKNNLSEYKCYQYVTNRDNYLIDYIMENSTFDIDNRELEKYTKQIMNEKYEYAEENNISKDDYLKYYLGLTKEEFNEICKDEAEYDIKYYLIMKNIFDKEGMDIESYYSEKLKEYAYKYDLGEDENTDTEKCYSEKLEEYADDYDFNKDDIETEEYYAKKLEEYANKYGFNKNDIITEIKKQMIEDYAFDIIKENAIAFDSDGNKISEEILNKITEYENN